MTDKAPTLISLLPDSDRADMTAANAKAVAQIYRTVFDAFVEAGFTEPQAMQLMCGVNLSEVMSE